MTLLRHNFSRNDCLIDEQEDSPELYVYLIIFISHIWLDFFFLIYKP